MVRWGRGWRRGSGTTTGALPAVSREVAEAPREAGSGTATGIGDDDRVTVGGVEAEGGDDAALREAAEAQREAVSMARHQGRQGRGR
jgi:hypothetical protein